MEERIVIIVRKMRFVKEKKQHSDVQCSRADDVMERR